MPVLPDAISQHAPGQIGGSATATDNDVLDNVVWSALSGTQRAIAIGDSYALRYPSSVAPFAALRDESPRSYRSLRVLIREGYDARVALFTPVELQPPSTFAVLRRARLKQMVLLPSPTGFEDPADEIVALGQSDAPDMLALAQATQPGPFGPRTNELGAYLGVRRAGVLIAMAGERMRLSGFTEISAVCVHPAFRGQGLAQVTVAALSASIAQRGDVPFLHVFDTNVAAIALYQKLGFCVRRPLHLAVLGRPSDVGGSASA